MPLYGMRWITIILNDFFPDFIERRIKTGKYNSFNISLVQNSQLSKAVKYCKRIKNNFNI